jgi:hypothetical protein
VSYGNEEGILLVPNPGEFVLLLEDDGITIALDLNGEERSCKKQASVQL